MSDLVTVMRRRFCIRVQEGLITGSRVSLSKTRMNELIDEEDEEDEDEGGKSLEVEDE